MSGVPYEQRNAYKGTPQRPWIRLRVLAVDGSTLELQLLADTGNPCAIIIGRQLMMALKTGDGPDVRTNFGPLEGGWLEVAMPDLRLNQPILAYAGDAVLAAVQASHADFVGLAGLPLLRLMEYGGDANWFWLRPAVASP